VDDVIFAINGLEQATQKTRIPVLKLILREQTVPGLDTDSTTHLLFILGSNAGLQVMCPEHMRTLQTAPKITVH